MENFIEQLLGQHTLAIFSASIVWILIYIAFIKAYQYPKGMPFRFRFWLNDNLFDVVLGIVGGMLLLRLGDAGIHLVQKHLWSDMPHTEDIVALMILVQIPLQHWLHKNRKPISKEVKEKMHVHNERCSGVNCKK